VDDRTESSDRGSAEPVESARDGEAAARPPLDPELLQEGSGVPFADALDTGDDGAPAAALGGSRSDSPPVTAGQAAAGSGVRPAALRDRESDSDDRADEPPLGGPTPSPDAA
jgi:hypothetical protein